ncbi:hypothetical protein CEQ90_00615 [Lewinellaceae bacterium SD302]|nr:hypothetical protein CEQ90_00615 [Lewinellaceae bacterium SD302]
MVVFMAGKVAVFDDRRCKITITRGSQYGNFSARNPNRCSGAWVEDLRSEVLVKAANGTLGPKALEPLSLTMLASKHCYFEAQQNYTYKWQQLCPAEKFDKHMSQARSPKRTKRPGSSAERVINEIRSADESGPATHLGRRAIPRGGF